MLKFGLAVTSFATPRSSFTFWIPVSYLPRHRTSIQAAHVLLEQSCRCQEMQNRAEVWAHSVVALSVWSLSSSLTRTRK